jgi:hypothetical protein
MIVLFSGGAYAGTLMVGLKGWYAFWNGAPNRFSEIVDDAVDEGIEQGLPGTVSTTASSKETGKGFLAGPVVAYQTDDRIWAFSLAFMYLSMFNYDTSANGTVVGVGWDGRNEINYNVELQRKEIDIAISRSVSTWMKVYAGYKYQRLENKIGISGSIIRTNPLPEMFIAPINSDVEITIYSHTPTAGLGFVVPFSEKSFFGLQTGVIYMMPEFESKATNNLTGAVEKESSSFKNKLGVNIEASVSFLAQEKILFQIGYRYQGVKLQRSDDGGQSGDPGVWDSFHGITFSALLLFSI